MPNPIRSKKKAATKPRKRKGKVVVRESVKVRPKTAEKRDTMIIAPTRVPDNSATLKIKIKRKWYVSLECC